MSINALQTSLPLTEAKRGNDPASIDNAARQLESQFAKMMIGMMRETALGDSMFPGAASQFRDLYDRELANVLSKGEGLGLQPMIRAQLSGQPQTAHSTAARSYSLAGYTRTPALDALRSPTPQPIPISQPTLPSAHPKAFVPLSEHEPSPVRQLTPSLDRSKDTTVAASVPGTPEAFVAEMWPHAQRAAAELGVSPKALLAQAALETGWGRRMPRQPDGTPANNLFGIKAGRGWDGPTLSARTREVIGGRDIQELAAFRAYESPEQSMADYVALLKTSPRYANAIGQQNPLAFAKALQQAGYATDPDYASKISAIANGPTLNRALASIDGGLVRSA